MQYFPLFLKLDNETVVFSGAGQHAAAKIRLLLKTNAKIRVFGLNPCVEVLKWHDSGKIEYHSRELSAKDVGNARLVYGANGDEQADQRAVLLGKQAGALTNIVDSLEGSDFLTPAIVDRDPVTIAIGTQGTAPVLARKLKAEIEDLVPVTTGLLAKIAQSFRAKAAKLPNGALRRDFWSKYFSQAGPRALKNGGPKAAYESLERLFSQFQYKNKKSGEVVFISDANEDIELLTIKARRKLHEADIVIHDNKTNPQILELARREADIICTDTYQNIAEQLIDQANDGAQIVRISKMDKASLDDINGEIAALDQAKIDWELVPSISPLPFTISKLETQKPAHKYQTPNPSSTAPKTKDHALNNMWNA